MTALAVPARIGKPQLLSLLWIFLVLNFIYCDVLALHDGGVLTSLINGRVGSLEITPVFLLAASFLMEVPIGMVVVSRLVRRSANRIANIVAASFMIVVQASSLFAGTAPSMSYVFFSAIEIGILVVILALAIRWRKPTA